MIPQYINLLIIVITDLVGLPFAASMAYIGYRLYRFHWNEYAVFAISWTLFSLSRFLEATYLSMLTASFLAGEIYFLDPLNSSYVYWWITVGLLDLACFVGLLIYQQYSMKYAAMLFIPILVRIGIDFLTFLIIMLIIITQLISGRRARTITYAGYISLAASYLLLGLKLIIPIDTLMLGGALLRLIGLLFLFKIIWRVE